MRLLMGVASRWKLIAEGLGFKEDLIDEIDPNNSTDEARLQDCVEQWVARLQPSWEKLSHVLRDMGEEELAQEAWSEDSVPCNGLKSIYTLEAEWIVFVTLEVFIVLGCYTVLGKSFNGRVFP